MNAPKPTMAIMVMAFLILVGCHGDMNGVWTGDSGRVPVALSAPPGFKISPHEAQVIAEQEYGMRKTVQHVYSDSRYYYIVDGFFGASFSKSSKAGVRVDGKTGKHTRFERG